MQQKLIGIITFVIGIVICVYVLRLWFKWSKVKTWPTVPGKVMATGFKEGKLYDWAGLSITYIPTIKYEYIYRELKYLGQCISVRDKNFASVDKNHAQKMLDVIGTSPDVFLNPSEPETAYLVNMLKWTHVQFLLTYGFVGLLLILIGIGLLVWL